MPNPSTIAEMEEELERMKKTIEYAAKLDNAQEDEIAKLKAELEAALALASHNAKYGQDKNQECDSLRQENNQLLAIIKSLNEHIARLHGELGLWR